MPVTAVSATVLSLSPPALPRTQGLGAQEEDLTWWGWARQVFDALDWALPSPNPTSSEATSPLGAPEH